jgi:hypothetical protein
MATAALVVRAQLSPRGVRGGGALITIQGSDKLACTVHSGCGCDGGGEGGEGEGKGLLTLA